MVTPSRSAAMAAGQSSDRASLDLLAASNTQEAEIQVLAVSLAHSTLAQASLAQASVARQEAAKSEDFSQPARARSLSACWLEEDVALVDQAMQKTLRTLGVSQRWTQRAMSVERSLQGFFMQLEHLQEQVALLKGIDEQESLYYVRSLQGRAMAVLPLPPLGRGGKKIIYRVLDVSRLQLAVFAKICPKECFCAEPLTQEELQAPRGLDALAGPRLICGHHPHVLAMQEVRALRGGLLGYLSPFIEGRNLSAVFDGKNMYARLLSGVALLNQGVEGVIFLHQQELCHRDIKGGNFMVDTDSGRVILIDLDGVCPKSKAFTTQDELIAEVTMNYLAPEVVDLLEALASNGSVEPASAAASTAPALTVVGDDLRPADVWALGVTFFTDVLNDMGVEAFYAAAADPLQLAKLHEAIKISVGERFRMAPELIEALTLLAKGVFCKEPGKRLSAEQLAQQLKEVQSLASMSRWTKLFERLAQHDS